MSNDADNTPEHDFTPAERAYIERGGSDAAQARRRARVLRRIADGRPSVPQPFWQSCRFQAIARELGEFGFEVVEDLEDGRIDATEANDLLHKAVDGFMDAFRSDCATDAKPDQGGEAA